MGNDPVADGFVTSLSRPSGNLTGVTTFASELGTKQFGLLHDVVPAPAVIGYLTDGRSLMPSDPQKLAVESAASALGRELIILKAGREGDIDAVFMSLGLRRIGGLVVSPGPFITIQLHQIVALANHYKIPIIYPRREFAEAGGLMSYETSFIDAYRQLGAYVGKVLKGAKTTDLPVLLPTKFEFIVNLHTAKLIGLTVPPTLLAVADEVIE
jgi:putative ABC transport system substrate-binding protein